MSHVAWVNVLVTFHHLDKWASISLFEYLNNLNLSNKVVIVEVEKKSHHQLVIDFDIWYR